MPQILVVDDNAIQAVTRRMILERAHLSAAVAESGPAAIARIEAGETFGVVITDHCMPEMDGPELVRRLRELRPELAVLVLSGDCGAEADYAGLDVLFRLKPIQPEALTALVHDLLFPPFDQTA